MVGELVLAIRAIKANQTYLSPEIGAIVADAYLHTSSPSSGTPAAVTLSPRQREILQLTAEGLNTKQIGQRLSRSVKTIEMHRRHTMEKLGLRSIADLTRYAIRTGLVSVDH